MKIRTIFEIQAIIDGRKIPYDIEEFLETERWCKSKERWVKYGDMDITHFTRAMLKDMDILKLRKSYDKTQVGLTIANITKQLEELNESLHERKGE